MLYKVNEMVYLNAVIKETLRMHPAVGMPLPRYVPAAGFQLGDNYFPPGAIVGVNAWHIHQHESIFGKDCGTFKPERWLEGSQNQLATMDKFLLSVRSRRSCPARCCITY
jgi:cytochrome P450